MPVGRMHLGESPDNSLDCQAPGDGGVPDHINAVIIIDELMAKCLAEDYPRNDGQKNADAEGRPRTV